MGSKRLLLICLVSLALAVMCCGSIPAATWYSESFDSCAAGSLAGQAGWTGVSGAVRVVTDFSRPGNCVEADALQWGIGDVTRNVTCGGGYQTIEFDAAIDMAGTATSDTNIGYLKIFNPSGGEITRLYFGFRRFKLLTSVQGQTLILDNLANRRWYHIRVGIDLTNNRLEAWIDGVQKIFGNPLHTASTSIGSITMGQWGQATNVTKSETYIDNIVCTGDSGQSSTADKILSPRFFPGWQNENVCYPFVIFDSSTATYRMYYAGSASMQFNDSCWDQWTTGYVTSTDAKKWAFPDNYEAVLYAHKLMEGDLVDPVEESKTFDSIFAYGACVLKEAGGYKMWYTGWNGDSEYFADGTTKKVNFRIGYATSPDGIDWTKHAGSAGAGSVLGLGSSGLDTKGVGHPHVINEGGTYRMWYEGCDGTTWRLFYATSTDGVTWTKQGVALAPGAGLDSRGLRNPAVITRNGQYELWYQGQSDASPNYRILRATSTDGVTWTKVSAPVDLHPNPLPAGDEKVLVDSIIVNPDGSCQVFFAKETTTNLALRYGTVKKKNFYIYTEVVNP